jgi:hypothetical protein
MILIPCTQTAFHLPAELNAARQEIVAGQRTQRYYDDV